MSANRDLITATAGEWKLSGIVKADTACECCTRRVTARAFHVTHPEHGELELGRRCAVRATGWKRLDDGVRIARRRAEVSRREALVAEAFPELAEAHRAVEERARVAQAAGFEPPYPGRDVEGRRFYLFQLVTTEDWVWRSGAECWREFVAERAA